MAGSEDSIPHPPSFEEELKKRHEQRGSDDPQTDGYEGRPRGPDRRDAIEHVCAYFGLRVTRS
jgi:hypothetical protein